MSLNTAHAETGVLIHAGEGILLFSDNVSVEFGGQESPEFRGTKTGRMYLTTHRMIFNAKSQNEAMRSFSFPFVSLSDVGVEQPLFGANYIKGKVRAQENGNWFGEAKFKLTFKSGGAIEFGQAMLKAAHMATRGMRPSDAPPPYTPPTGPWYAAPPPAYAPPPQGYYGWVPPVHAFPDQPPPNSVFVSSSPPPYPGIVNMGPNPNQAGGFAAPPSYPGPPTYPPPQGYSNGQGFSNSPGFQPPAGAPGFQPSAGAPGYPNQSFPGAQGGTPYSGASAPQHSQDPLPGGLNDAKAAEAAQSAYYDPNRPQMAFVPPPAYYEQPPSYQQSMNKKEQ